MSFTRQIGTAESTKTFERSEEAFAKSRPGAGVERGAGFDKKPRAKRRGVCEITAARFAPAPRAGGKSGRRGLKPRPPQTPSRAVPGCATSRPTPNDPKLNRMRGLVASFLP